MRFTSGGRLLGPLLEGSELVRYEGELPLRLSGYDRRTRVGCRLRGRPPGADLLENQKEEEPGLRQLLLQAS